MLPSSSFTLNNLINGTVKANTPGTVNNPPAKAAPAPMTGAAAWAELTRIGTRNRQIREANAWAAANIAGAGGATQPAAAAPVTTSGGSYASGGGSGGSGGGTAVAPPPVLTMDPEAAQMYADEMTKAQNQINGLGGLQDSYMGNIGNSYNNSLKDTNDQFAIAERNYNDGRSNTIADNELAKSNIDRNVATNQNSLARLLGIAGSGNSSAARYAALLAARQGTNQRSEVQKNYSRNLQGMDTAFGDTRAVRDKNVLRLGEDKFAKEQALKKSINDNKSSLLQTLATLGIQKGQALGKTYSQARSAADPYSAQIRNIQAANQGLARDYQNPLFNTAGVAFAAPQLASYNSDNAGIRFDGQTAATEQVAPAYQRGFKKDEKGNLIV